MEDTPSLLVLSLTLLSLLIISGFFSGSETGMMAANKIKLKNLSKKSKRSAKRALTLLKRPDQLLSAILVGNNFANILASAIVTIMMINYFGGNVLLGSIILTIVILIFSEITPKTIATIKPESFATKSSFILNVLVKIFKPLIFLTNFLSRLILKIFKLDAKDATLNDNLNTEELRTLLDESGDLIPKQYRKMLSSVLGMEELVVEDIMIPTSEIIGIDISKNYECATKTIESTDYTRLPVYDESIDNLVGILHLKDSHAFLEQFHLNNKNNLSKLLQDTYFVSQSTLLMKQLREFLANNQSVALVVDEYGEIEGLISVEDIFKDTLPGNIIKLIIDKNISSDHLDALVIKLTTYKPVELRIDYDVNYNKLKIENDEDYDLSGVDIKHAIEEFVNMLDIENKKDVVNYSTSLYERVK